MDLTGRCALVTGGAVRVGRALALALAREGMRVVVHYHALGRRPPRSWWRSIARRGRGGGRHRRRPLAPRGGGAAGATRRRRPSGGWTCWSTTPPSSRRSGWRRRTRRLWDDTLAVNLRAPFFLTQRLGGGCARGGAGWWSTWPTWPGLQAWAATPRTPSPRRGWCTSRAWPRARSRRRCAWWRSRRARCCRPRTSPRRRCARLAERTPLRATARPDDVVEAMLYLLRADFVTGEVLVLDGGRRLRD